MGFLFMWAGALIHLGLRFIYIPVYMHAEAREKETTGIFLCCPQILSSFSVCYWTGNSLFELNCMGRELGRYPYSHPPSIKIYIKKQKNKKTLSVSESLSFEIPEERISLSTACTSVWSSLLYEQLLFLCLIIMTNKK